MVFMPINYIDFEDIEKPIKSYIRDVAMLRLQYGQKVKTDITLSKNTLNDNTSRFQMFSSEEQTEFLSVQDTTNMSSFNGDILA